MFFKNKMSFLGQENGKIKQHYKELYDSIKNSCIMHLEQGQCPINEKHREVHLVYLKHLKESVETLREIVEEAEVERPLDSSLASACHYTKHSQELLEYVIDTCPKDLNTRDNKHASTPLPKKKQVTFEEHCAIVKSNNTIPVEQLNCQKNYSALCLASNKSYQWIPTGRTFTLGEQCPLTRLTKPNKVSAIAYVANPREPNHNWGNFPNSPSLLFSNAGRTDCPLNGVVERQNRTLVEAARTMLIFSKAPMFYGQKLWLLRVTPKTDPLFTLITAKPHMSWCMTRSLILTFSESLVSLLPYNNSEDLGKYNQQLILEYSLVMRLSRKGYRIYNKRTRRIMETIHVQFDELTEQMAPVQLSTGPAPTLISHPFINVFALEPSSEALSSRDLIEPKNFKSAITKDCWFQAMQDEIHEFDRLQVWELVPQPDCVMIIALKWIYKVKLDEYSDVLKNKARLVAKGY
ncbi:retrovirus-related pol polyprotein from transposon TNT 1-94 [Tanacetum coccineum]